MAAPSWDSREQFDALQARKRHEESLLARSGSILALASAVLLAGVLAVNDDTNTILVLGGLNLTILLGWVAVARRIGLQARRWRMKARGIEKEVLRIPGVYSLWEETGLDPPPAWIAAGIAMVALAVFWVGLMAYAFWVTYLPTL